MLRRRNAGRARRALRRASAARQACSGRRSRWGPNSRRSRAPTGSLSARVLSATCFTNLPKVLRHHRCNSPPQKWILHEFPEHDGDASRAAEAASKPQQVMAQRTGAAPSFSGTKAGWPMRPWRSGFTRALMARTFTEVWFGRQPRQRLRFHTGSVAGNLLRTILRARRAHRRMVRVTGTADVIAEIADDLYYSWWHLSEYPTVTNRAHLPKYQDGEWEDAITKENRVCRNATGSPPADRYRSAAEDAADHVANRADSR